MYCDKKALETLRKRWAGYTRRAQWRLDDRTMVSRVVNGLCLPAHMVDIMVYEGKIPTVTSGWGLMRASQAWRREVGERQGALVEEILNSIESGHPPASVVEGEFSRE